MLQNTSLYSLYIFDIVPGLLKTLSFLDYTVLKVILLSRMPKLKYMYVVFQL